MFCLLCTFKVCCSWMDAPLVNGWHTSLMQESHHYMLTSPTQIFLSIFTWWYKVILFSNMSRGNWWWMNFQLLKLATPEEEMIQPEIKKLPHCPWDGHVAKIWESDIANVPHDRHLACQVTLYCLCSPPSISGFRYSMLSSSCHLPI